MNILRSLFRKRRKKENIIKYILFLLHIWGGICVGVLISFIAITGAIYVFKSEIEDLSARHYINRNADAKDCVSLRLVASNFMDEFDTKPARIVIPEEADKNIRVSGGGRGSDQIIAFADKQTGEILGTVSPAVSNFFWTIFRLHRWFNTDNPRVFRQIVAGATVAFMFFILSGIVLWWPVRGKKKPFKNKFNARLKYGFHVFNRDFHINFGAMASVFLLLITWTGIYFTYPNVREITIGMFQTKAEKEEAKQQKIKREKMAKNNPRSHQRRPEKSINDSIYTTINYEAMISEAQEKLNYKGDVSFIFPGHHFSNITIRKTNTNNFLGAVLHDDITFDETGKQLKTQFWSDKTTSLKIRSLIKSLHTGEILGLKSKILYFLIALFAAYLPISGYIMWFKKLRVS
nr:PepSY-associated TM helix domain-containing protein [uncultured Carboxylicivirga sp.]